MIRLAAVIVTPLLCRRKGVLVGRGTETPTQIPPNSGVARGAEALTVSGTFTLHTELQLPRQESSRRLHVYVCLFDV